VLAYLAATLLAVSCPPNAAAQVRAPGTQLITVQAPSTTSTQATLHIWAREDGCWIDKGGPYPARVGWAGLRRNRHEGDGTTPIGTFPIGPTMYGNAPDPGVRFPYRRIRCGDWWVEDPASPAYNSFRHVACGKKPPFRTPTPDMSKSPRAYRHLAIIEFNMHPVVPGRGSGIFLHATTGRPTNGCVSLPVAALVQVLRWLDPAAKPHIAIGPRASTG
jgi:L,D-peptidoglycan transpeptidase YkuD (ErfK/YbiS/YcfS/YnhG family)